MPLKGKNKNRWLMAALLMFGFISGCQNEPEEPEEIVAARVDSVSKATQRKRADSLKRSNPLLIVPPDSVYTGTYIDKYDNGITKFRGFFRFGKKHGQWVSFYPNGLPWSELHFERGKREGPNITYFENGKIRYQGIYRNDARDSIWLYYDSLGNVAERVVYKNDRIVKKLGPGK